MRICPLIYNNKQRINSANHLGSIMNIQGESVVFKFVSVNQTIIFNADRITHTFKCVRALTMNFNTVKAALPADKNKHK